MRREGGGVTRTAPAREAGVKGAGAHNEPDRILGAALVTPSQWSARHGVKEEGAQIEPGSEPHDLRAGALVVSGGGGRW
jgi:hypothetical protein